NHKVVAEFFELFKTGWEFYRSGQQYDAVMSDGFLALEDINTKFVILYGGRILPDEVEFGEKLTTSRECNILRYRDLQLPIYGDGLVFPSRAPSLLSDPVSGQPASYSTNYGGRTVLRIGYDLFSEVRLLLTTGQ